MAQRKCDCSIKNTDNMNIIVICGPNPGILVVSSTQSGWEKLTPIYQEELVSNATGTKWEPPILCHHHVFLWVCSSWVLWLHKVIIWVCGRLSPLNCLSENRKYKGQSTVFLCLCMETFMYLVLLSYMGTYIKCISVRLSLPAGVLFSHFTSSGLSSLWHTPLTLHRLHPVADFTTSTSNFVLLCSVHILRWNVYLTPIYSVCGVEYE